MEVLENESSDKSQEIQSLEARLAVLEKEKISLNQRIKGLKNGSARKLNIPAASTSTKRKVTKTPSRGTMTTIEVGTKSSDIVILHQQVGKSCFKGKRFSGSNDSQKKSTTGHVNLYFEVPEKHKNCSEINKKEIQRSS